MNLFKYIQSNDFIKIVLVLVIVYFIYTYMSTEGLENVEAAPEQVVEQPIEQPIMVMQEPIVSEAQQEQQILSAAAEKEALKAEDLLPQYDDANEFAKQNPVSKLLKEQNFLISGYHAGINTVLQSNKIPYHDIRSVPPIPKESVGPWAQSSYETPVGSNRRQLEIS
jgi:hypothetical protein